MAGRMYGMMSYLACVPPEMVTMLGLECADLAMSCVSEACRVADPTQTCSHDTLKQAFILTPVMSSPPRETLASVLWIQMEFKLVQLS